MSKNPFNVFDVLLGVVWLLACRAALEAVARDARAEAIEHAAQVCESRWSSLCKDDRDYHAANEAQKCAVAIRWLTTQPDRFPALGAKLREVET